MTLLVRLGEGRGREGCLFHKTVDMHFSTGCFSFALCSKKDSVKQKSGSVCSKKKKKKRGLPPRSLQPWPWGGHATLWLSPPQDVPLPRVPTHVKKNRPTSEGPQVGLPACVPRGCTWARAKGVRVWAWWSAQSLAAGSRGTCCCPGLTGSVTAKPVFLLEPWRIGFPSKIASVNCFTSQEDLCQTAYLPWPHARLKQSLSDSLVYFWICTPNLRKGRSFASQASKSNPCQTISFIH